MQLARLALPIHVSCHIGTIDNWMFQVFHGWFFGVSQAWCKDCLRVLIVLVILRTEAAIVHEYVGVATRAITLVVEGGGLALRTGRHMPINIDGVTIEMLASVAHAILKLRCEAAIVTDDLVVAATAITVIVYVFWIESSLHWRVALIRLRSSREIHRWFCLVGLLSGVTVLELLSSPLSFVTKK